MAAPRTKLLSTIARLLHFWWNGAGSRTPSDIYCEKHLWSTQFHSVVHEPNRIWVPKSWTDPQMNTGLALPYRVLATDAECPGRWFGHFKHQSKARSTPATMSKQHCRSNRQLCCLLLRQCRRFGQQCRSNVRLCRKDEISTKKLVRHCWSFWLQSRTLLRHCCWCGPGLTKTAHWICLAFWYSNLKFWGLAHGLLGGRPCLPPS